MVATSPPSVAQDSATNGPANEGLEEVTVEGRRQDLTGEALSASQGVIGHAELENRPLLRPGDVLEAIPGMIMTQHSGTGKSNQMFLRGFNLDHGTDFATWVDGMPVNLRTHGHGQGYTDINFLIPELIRTIEYSKGPYHAELGDFSSAGGAHIRTFDRVPRAHVSLGVGAHGYRRALAAGSGPPALNGGSNGMAGTLLGAIEVQAYDGPWTDIDEDLDKVNGLLRWSDDDGPLAWGATAMFYDADWNSADQIPERAVGSGLIGPLGSIDTTVGGESRRVSLSGWLSRDTNRSATWVGVYAIDYDLQLWSNFTYFLDDPENGDQFEQLDRRQLYGGTAQHEWFGANGNVRHRVGLEVRYDDIDEVGLFRTRARERLSVTRLDTVGELSLGTFYGLDWRVDPRWRAVLGVRADWYRFEVESSLPENSGSEDDAIVSPKASLIYTVSEDTEAYLSGGFGFHSNDARGTTISIDPMTGEPVEPVDPLVRSKGAEVGLRTLWRERLHTTLALWYLKLDSELLYIGDAGTTEASRPSRRWGVEFNNYWRMNDIWTLEADFAWADSAFTDDAPQGDEIPAAISTVVTVAATAELPWGPFGSLRLRHFGDAPLIEDGGVESDGSTMLNLALGWQGAYWRVQLDVLNLLDSDDHDIDYFYASRLPGEPADGVEDVHFHIFEPRQARLQISYLF